MILSFKTKRGGEWQANNQTGKSLIAVNDRWCCLPPVLLSRSNEWRKIDCRFSFFGSVCRERKSRKWVEESERNSGGAHEGRRFVLSACVCVCVTEFTGIVSRLGCVILDYTSGSLPRIDWTCRTLALTIELVHTQSYTFFFTKPNSFFFLLVLSLCLIVCLPFPLFPHYSFEAFVSCWLYCRCRWYSPRQSRRIES